MFTPKETGMIVLWVYRSFAPGGLVDEVKNPQRNPQTGVGTYVAVFSCAGC
jgi:hypothetical protein